METALYANSDCRLCHGKGRVRQDDRMASEAICLCVIAGKRLADAERLIGMRLPERAAQMKLDDYDPGDDPKNAQALQLARNFVDNYEQAAREGWVLGFWGLPGSGKTHLTLGIAQDCARRYLAKPYVFNVSTALRGERERFRAQQERRFQAGTNATPPPSSPIDRAVQAELLILDDLGAEYHRQGSDATSVSWVYEQLYLILESRIMACRPTLFSSNFSPGDLARRMDNEAGKRVLSRIERAQVAPALEVVEVPGANRQSEAAALKLFAPRLSKDFELHNRLSGRRRRYDQQSLLDVIARFRDSYGEDAVAEQLEVARVARDGKSVREPADMAQVFALLAESAAHAPA